MTPSDTEIMEIAARHANLFRVPPMIGKLGTDPLAETIANAIVEALDKIDGKEMASELLRVAGDRDSWFNKYLLEVEKVKALTQASDDTVQATRLFNESLRAELKRQYDENPLNRAP